MPNRVLRDWTGSETIDQLSEGAEILFVRLIMKADDHGCFYGNPKLIKGALFPLRNYTEKQILNWINELQKSKVIVVYQVGGKNYVRIENFNQRLRLMRSKYPQPESGQFIEPSNDGHVSDNGRPETKRNEVETESETNPKQESETETPADAEPEIMIWPTFEDWWILYDKSRSKSKCEKKWIKIIQVEREKIMAHTGQYVLATPEKQYRKDPYTYLNNHCWTDEIIYRQNGKIADDIKHTVRAIDGIVADRDYS